MIKRFLVLVLAAGAFAVANAAPVSESSAAGLKGSQTITLAADEDGNYVYYFKATLKRSMAYTVYTTGLGSETNITLDIYAKDASKDSESEPSATFDEIAESGGNIRQVMYADSWYIDEDDPDESDPASWTYYFAFLGDGPTTFTVYFSTGVQVPTGREENPFSISPGKSPATKQTNLEMDGEYYFRARLTEGRLYRFGTSGGSIGQTVSDGVDAVRDFVTNGVLAVIFCVYFLIDAHNLAHRRKRNHAHQHGKLAHLVGAAVERDDGRDDGEHELYSRNGEHHIEHLALEWRPVHALASTVTLAELQKRREHGNVAHKQEHHVHGEEDPEDGCVLAQHQLQ